MAIKHRSMVNNLVHRKINGYNRVRSVSTGHALIENYLMPALLGSFVLYVAFNIIKEVSSYV